MKKIYITPATMVTAIEANSLMEASRVTPDGGETTNWVTPTEGEGQSYWAGSKENGDWDGLWDE